VATSPPAITQLAPPPLPPCLIRRPRLTERLARGVEGPTTLVSGPAGSGKSVLIASWLASGSPPGPVAWAMLDPAHDAPAPFWRLVLAALRQAGIASDGGALPALDPPDQAGDRAFAPALVNALAELPGPCVLVLDDCHVLHDATVLDQLAFLLLHAPRQLRVVLSARADPAVSLHVLRVRGGLVEIRARHLAFTDDETGALLSAHGVDLPGRLVGALRERTEGWAAGLRLAALSLQDRDDPARFVDEFAGDDRVVGDYLVAEVLDRLPPRRRAFLLRTAVADRLCGDLADALTGDDDGAAVLAELERTNAFVVALDAHGGWYRRHALFGELLRARLPRELRDEVPELHRRAARWHAEHGMPWDALRHSIAARDWEHAAGLMVRHWFELVVHGRGSAMGSLVRSVPEERIAGDPELAAAVACAHLEAGDLEAAGRHLAVARAVEDRLPEPRRARYRQTTLLARTYMARVRGRSEEAVALADELLSTAAPTDGTWCDSALRAVALVNRGAAAVWGADEAPAAADLEHSVAIARGGGFDHVAAKALGHLALLRALRGGPDLAAAPAQQALQLGASRGPATARALAPLHVALAVSALDAVQLEQAEEHVARAHDAARGLHERHLDIALAHVDGRIRAARGRAEEAVERLARAEAALGPCSGPAEAVLLGALRARMLDEAGGHESAREALGAVRAGAPAVAELDAVAGRLRLAGGDDAGALAALAPVSAGGRRGMLGVTRVEVPLLEALAHQGLGERGAAATSLERALEQAESLGHRSVFLDAGRRARGLLAEHVHAGTAHRALVSDLLDAFDDRRPQEAAVTPLLEPLSQREVAVLRFLPTMLSNSEIAAELFVSTNTVKTHLRSIYRKLDVGRRREAVARARALRLLSAGGRR
jgi:LuxR family transcriptional regulator, maltose regulon positive regulatory protein